MFLAAEPSSISTCFLVCFQTSILPFLSPHLSGSPHPPRHTASCQSRTESNLGCSSSSGDDARKTAVERGRGPGDNRERGPCPRGWRRLSSALFPDSSPGPSTSQQGLLCCHRRTSGALGAFSHAPGLISWRRLSHRTTLCFPTRLSSCLCHYCIPPHPSIWITNMSSHIGLWT